MMTKIKLLFLTLFLLFTTISNAQSVSVRVANQVVQGQRFAVTLTVKNGQANVTREYAPTLPGCTLLAGPGVSTMHSVEIINGRQSSSVSTDYTFTYSADKAGTITIPAIKVVVEGKELSTQPRQLTILPPDQASSQNNRSSRGNGYSSALDEMDELMNELLGGGGSRQQPRTQPQQPTKITDKDFIVTVNLSKSNIYEKEAIIATINLYTKYNVTKFQPVVMPQFEGFLSEEIDVSNQTPHQEHFRGENYYTLVLKKCLLYPQKSGKLTINSGTYDVTLETVSYVSNGFFATPVPQSHNFTTSSNSISVNVNPLPTPIPLSFNGAVGDFNVSAELVPEQLRTNEAAKYMLKITGTGNIKHLAEPNIPLPPTVEQYTPSGESNAKFNGSNMTGSYTATYTFVPQETGKLTIPSWDFTFFNPATGKYVTQTLPSFERNVAKGIASGNSGASKSTDLDTKAISDIRHIKKVKDKDISMVHKPLFHNPLYWGIYLVALLGLTITVILYRSRIKARADVQGQRLRKARSVATKRLQKAQTAMSAHDSDAFYAALSSALWGFMSDKLKIPASSLTRDNIADTLTAAGASQQMVEDTIHILDDCEMARFTPVHTDTEMSSLYSKAASVIDTLNKLKLSTPTQKKTTQRSRYE